MAIRDAPAGGKLTLLIIDSVMYINTISGVACSSQAQRVQRRPVDIADDVMKQMNLEPPQMTIVCYPDSICDPNQVQSLAVYDSEHENFVSARASIIYTSIVVVMLTGLVLFFAVEMKRQSNNTLFHPLWDLMDDMCALKCMEVVAEKNPDSTGSAVGIGDEALVAQAEPDWHEMIRHRRHKFLRRCYVSSQPAAELSGLRDAFVHLRGAITTWGKYVPSILLKQLIEAGVEAEIGCAHKEVSIYFCDIANFQDLCDGKKPKKSIADAGQGVRTHPRPDRGALWHPA
jgi:hypothetical protein